ncbi:hypothetical protein ACJX0J_035645, partial [Zea mays]
MKGEEGFNVSLHWFIWDLFALISIVFMWYYTTFLNDELGKEKIGYCIMMITYYQAKPKISEESKNRTLAQKASFYFMLWDNMFVPSLECYNNKSKYCSQAIDIKYYVRVLANLLTKGLPPNITTLGILQSLFWLNNQEEQYNIHLWLRVIPVCFICIETRTKIKLGPSVPCL